MESNFFDEHRKQISIEDENCSLCDNTSCSTKVQSDNLKGLQCRIIYRQQQEVCKTGLDKSMQLSELHLYTVTLYGLTLYHFKLSKTN